MRKNILSILMLVAVLLMAACNPSREVQLTIDNTKPVSTENRVIYQLNIGAFTPEGTFQAAQAQLNRLDTLGIDIIWLMPIYPRGMAKCSPYASMNFREVNPSYGTTSDVKAFVDAAHEHGMKVWLDWVPNHVAVENPWVNEHPEYFTKDAKGKMIHPNGWNDVLELNYLDEGLATAMNDALKFWMDECGIDGFRCDYVSSPTIPVRYWQNIIAELKSRRPGTELLSETDITNPYNRRIDSCGFDYDYAWDFQTALAWKFRNSANADSLRHICEEMLETSAQVKNHRMVYLTNHDQNYNDGGNTLKDFFGDNRYGMTVLEFTFYGMPLLYQGQEIGDPDTLNYFTDAKVKWHAVDQKMKQTVRTLVALHHQQPALAADAPVEWIETDSPSVLAYRRLPAHQQSAVAEAAPVIVVLNLSDQPVNAQLTGVEAGTYTRQLDSSTIADGPSASNEEFGDTPTIALDAKGYAVFVKQ